MAMVRGPLSGALFTAAAFVANPARVAEVFRTPDLHAVLFFAFFILTDPPTSPVKYRDQIICGVIVAIVSFAVFETTGVVYYLLAGVLVGKVWEGWRRWRPYRFRSTPAADRMGLPWIRNPCLTRRYSSSAPPVNSAA